jgi:hypothetical protein
LAIPPLVDGYLPLGRHVCDWRDIDGNFVKAPRFADSTTRPALWANLITGTQLLVASAVVYQVWLAGSLTTDKVDPGDVDVTYLIDGDDHYSRSPGDRRVIESFVPSRDPVTGRPRPRTHGLNLDSYIIDWWSYVGKDYTGVQAPEELYNAYVDNRGYWDDWWQRRRSGAKGAPLTLRDALPRRGFLEVQVRDFIV